MWFYFTTHCQRTFLLYLCMHWVDQKPHRSILFKSFPYSLAFVSYSVGGKEGIEEKEQCRKCVIDVFYVLVHLCMQEQVSLSSAFMSLLLDSSIHPVFTHRTLVLVFHCILVYKQPPPSLHRQHYCAVWYLGCTTDDEIAHWEVDACGDMFEIR